MKITVEGLPTDPQDLLKTAEQLVLTVDKLSRELERAKQTIEKLQHLHFGRKSEKLDPLQQFLAFDSETGAESPPAESAPAAPELAGSQSTEDAPLPPKAKRKGHGRRRLPEEIRRITIEHTLTPEERKCRCGGTCERIGEEISEQADWIPSSLVVLRHVRIKYGCEVCEGRVVTAPVADKVIEKGLPGTGLLAHVITSKYADHLPLHRLERIFGRHGFSFARSTMCGWMDLCADLLSPIVLRMWELVMLSFVIHTDDTTLPIRDETRDRLRQGRLWVYCGDVDHPYILYEYSPDHSEKYPLLRLANYRGHIQADGYSAYAKLCDDVNRHLVSCWAHTRRYFFEAQKNDRARATTALAFIQELYAVEKFAKEQHLDAAARLALRQERSAPILTRFKTWLDDQAPRVLPAEAIGKAIGYALNRWPELLRYTTDGRLKIDNGAAERAIRDIAIGRKNWLFATDDAGGHRSAVIYSIVQSCKRSGVNVYEYLRDVLDRVSTHPAGQIDELLPGRWKRTTVPAAQPGTPAQVM